MSPDAKKIVEDHAIGTEAAFHLSRLPPEQQSDAASQLASGAILSEKDYQPPETGTSAEPPPPFKLGDKSYATIQESVKALKDMTKDCSCTPDIFLATITEFVKKFQGEVSWYTGEYYAPVFPALSPVQLQYLRQQMDTIRDAAD